MDAGLHVVAAYRLLEQRCELSARPAYVEVNTVCAREQPVEVPVKVEELTIVIPDPSHTPSPTRNAESNTVTVASGRASHSPST